MLPFHCEPPPSVSDLNSNSTGTSDVVSIGQMRKRSRRGQGTGPGSHTRLAGSRSKMPLRVPLSFAFAGAGVRSGGWRLTCPCPWEPVFPGGNNTCGRGRAWTRARRSDLGLPLHPQFPELSVEAPWGSRQSFPAHCTNPPACCQGRKRKWPGQAWR